MGDFLNLIQHGNGWLFIPSAILLGVLHGLEPGHSKTMMAAFIIAIRGTVKQAVLLGLAATLSHTAIVWAIAMLGLYFGRGWNAETSEPYFQIVSAIILIGMAIWMALVTRYHAKMAHDHDHDHDDHDHDHDHDHEAGMENLSLGYQDPHELAHAKEIQHRFAGRQVTTGQIVIFGLTGGLIPCPASITVLLLCLQLKQIALGATLVLCFSIGLALTMVASGVLAAMSIKHVSGRWSGFGEFARKAPYFSAVLILLVGIYVGYHGISALQGR